MSTSIQNQLPNDEIQDSTNQVQQKKGPNQNSQDTQQNEIKQACNQQGLQLITSKENQQQKVIKFYPYKVLTGHWMTISRPQYKRTCGISSLVSLWNFQFSKLGMGTKQPISIQQAMLKLNLIGNGSIQQNMRKKFKKTAQLTQKPDVVNQPMTQGQTMNTFAQEKVIEDATIRNNNLSLDEYINTIDFGCFTGNDTLLKWYRLLCRIYGGSGRSYLFYKTNSDRSIHKTQQSAKKALVQGLNSNGKTCFIYHAYDHYFCPVGYEFVPKNDENPNGTFSQQEISQKDNQLYVMIGQSSKMFPCMHIVKWNQIQLDLQTYWPQFFNIRRRKQGVQFYKGKQNQPSRGNTIDCIMAFQKIKD